MKFTYEEIKRIVASEKNYRLIERLKDYDIIDRYVIDYSETTDLYELVANITSAGRGYRSSLQWDKNNYVTHYKCDCIYCTSESACAHIGVLMEAVNTQEPSIFPFYFENERYTGYDNYVRKKALRQNLATTSIFIERQKEEAFSFDPATSESIELLAFLKQQDGYYPDNAYAIGFKVGNKRKYIVKNIKTFLKNVALEIYESYGKGFSTFHKRSSFKESSQNVLQFMQDLLVLQEDDFGYNQREFLLNSTAIDYFFERFSNLPKNSNVEFKEVSLSNFKIKLTSQREGDYYEVSLNDNLQFIEGHKALYQVRPSYTPGKDYQCIKYDIDENKNVVDFFRHIKHRPLVLDAKTMGDFDRYVFNEVRDYFEIEGDPIDRMLLDNRVELYGDIGQFEDVIFSVKSFNDSLLLNETFKTSVSSSLDFMRLIEIFKYYDGVFNESFNEVCFDLNQERTTDFLHEGLNTINSLAVVYVSESLKRLSLYTPKTIRVGLTFTNNLLGIDFEQDDIPKEELKDVLNAYKRKKKFYRLKSGETVVLDEDGYDSLNSFLEQMGSKIDDIEDGQLWVNPYRVFTLDFLGDIYSEFEVEKSESFKKHLEMIQQVDPSKIEIPNSINATLRSYQKDGYRWLCTLNGYGFGGILADDMGLGKTLQMITYFANKPKETIHLVVCPSSVLLNWQQEISKFAPDLNVVTVSGTKQTRLELLEDLSGVDVVITSYDYLRRDIEELKEISFDSVVLDEAQYIKNHNSLNSKSVKKLQAKQRFALTGTPIENSLAELWSIFDFLMPGYLYKYSYFKEHYESPIIKENDEKVSRELKRLVQPFILRRLKSDVLDDLPEKTETNMLIEFSEEEKKLYYANLAQVNQELQEASKVEQVSEIQVLAMLTRLRRICCEPRTIYDNIQHRSSKTEAVIAFISDLKADGKKTLLFSSFTSVLDLLAIELEREKISYRMIDGRVDKTKRQERIDEFQNGDVDVFLISLRAGGTGINLTAAEVVIHFDPWWNISAQNQATDRAYRIGQLNNVFVYKFIMKGTIEEKIQRLQDKKKQLSDTFVEDSDGSVAVMNREEIISLFSMDDIE